MKEQWKAGVSFGLTVYLSDNKISHRLFN